MGKQFTALLIILFSVIFMKPAFNQMTQDSIDAYTESIKKFRTGKNIKLMYNESTPLTPVQHKNFKGLNYFDPDTRYLLEGHLVVDQNPETVILRTSTERAPEYVKYGKILFELDGEQYELIAYQSKKLLDVKPDDSTLFIPFRDATSGNETYGGGRYVDVELPASGSAVVIDFNKAYNPYCAYNPGFSCVIPPGENRLPVRIAAGEKIFGKH